METLFSFRPRSTPTEPPTRVPVDIRRLPWMRRLATDYAFDFRQLAPFYAGDPSASSSWAAAIARVQARGGERARIAQVVAAQQRRREAPARAIEAGSRLADPRTVAIVTGQQAGLFGGPLYTLLKALTAIKIADQVSHDHHVPAVAVFWIDAEDHDWDEVRSCTVLDDTLTPRTVSLPADAAPEGAPIATVRLTDAVSVALDELERALPATEFRPSLLAALRRAYAPGVGMADAFGRWIESVLGDRGLVVYDAADPASKPLASGIFVRELSAPGRTMSLAGAAGADLVAGGYHAQVQTPTDGLALFRLGGHAPQDQGTARRRAIRQQDGHLLVDDTRYETAALVGEAGHRPDGFSPNVLLRPIVQDTVFPTICYVAGPSELAYLGQLRGVYEHFGVPMPLMYPRASATLVDAAVQRFLTKYGLSLEALEGQDDTTLNALVATQIPPEIEASLAGAARAIDTGMAKVIETIPALDPTLEGAARTTLGRMQHDLQTLNGKMIQAAKKRDETLKRQFARARALTFPGGHSQERAVAFLSFLNQYGPALVERLDDELPLDMGRHWIVTV
jgi:bacillithiol biosynthesis cysteine-adding enzyme BshC